MMNERMPLKDLALRKSSINAVIIIQTESIWNLPRALAMSMCWTAQTGTQISLGDRGR